MRQIQHVVEDWLENQERSVVSSLLYTQQPALERGEQIGKQLHI